MRLAHGIALLSIGATGLAACGEDDPCEGVTGTCIALTEGASAMEVQTAFIEIESGGTIAFGEGTFSFATDLSLDVDGVTIKGAGMDSTILSFKKQVTGAQGILVTGNDFVIHDIGLEDSPGDALKILGTQNVHIYKTRVEWTGGPAETNGAYGLYPVQCTNVLIEDSVVKGASDAGIYVGQSNNIMVRRNRAELNVAGIEIENSTHADVTENVATNNTGGILVFNLPGLDVANGAGTRVFANEVFENNTVNFAPVGNIVGKVPTGTGIVILAAHDVDIFDNDIRDHKSINIGMISYVPVGTPDDPNYDQYPTGIHIHDNRMSGVSDKPTGELGAALILGLGEIVSSPPYIVPDIAWDGVLDPARVPLADEDRICIHDNGDADFLNLAWPLGEGELPSRDMSGLNCSLPALPPVDL
ncbi:MAG: parallel beta-helix domain-containing protein [Kofleriaceae bacterium]